MTDDEAQQGRGRTISEPPAPFKVRTAEISTSTAARWIVDGVKVKRALGSHEAQ